MAKISIESEFSRAAQHYEAHAHVQALAAQDLLRYSLQTHPEAILELGCGTGLYTQMLLDSLPYSRIEAVDISQAMIDVARSKIDHPSVSFRCTDAESLTTGRYDLITSNATLHWFYMLDTTLQNMKCMLTDNGILTFSYFGPETYRELSECLRYVTGSSIRLACSDFLVPGDIRSLLAAHFRVCTVEEHVYTEDFASVKELLRSIKLTGTRGVNANGMAWTKGLLARLEDGYLERHGSIRASYQVYICAGRN